MRLVIISFSPPSSQLFTLPQLPLSLASSSSLFPLLLTMPQVWLRVLVYDWVTLLRLWSSPSLSIFSYAPALPFIYPSTSPIWLYCLLFAWSSCGVSLPLIILSSSFSSIPWLPHFVSLSLSLPICFLLLQSFIYSASRTFSPQPGLLLTDSVWFCNAHARKTLSVQSPKCCN